MSLDIVEPNYDEEWKKIKNSRLNDAEEAIRREFKDVKRESRLFFISVGLLPVVVVALFIEFFMKSGRITGIDWLDGLILTLQLVICYFCVQGFTSKEPRSKKFRKKEYDNIIAIIENMYGAETFDEGLKYFEQFASMLREPNLLEDEPENLYRFLPSVKGFVGAVRVLEEYREVSKLNVLDFEVCGSDEIAFVYENETGIVQRKNLWFDEVKESTRVERDALCYEGGWIVLTRKYQPD